MTTKGSTQEDREHLYAMVERLCNGEHGALHTRIRKLEEALRKIKAQQELSNDSKHTASASWHIANEALDN